MYERFKESPLKIATFNIEEDILEALKTRAKSEERSQSSTINRILRNELMRKPLAKDIIT